MSDPAKYRTAEELEEHKKRDPLAKSRADLEARGLATKLDELDASVEAEVADAIQFANESPEPGPEILEPTTYAGSFAR